MLKESITNAKENLEFVHHGYSIKNWLIVRYPETEPTAEPNAGATVVVNRTVKFVILTVVTVLLTSKKIF